MGCRDRGFQSQLGRPDLARSRMLPTPAAGSPHPVSFYPTAPTCTGLGVALVLCTEDQLSVWWPLCRWKGEQLLGHQNWEPDVLVAPCTSCDSWWQVTETPLKLAERKPRGSRLSRDQEPRPAASCNSTSGTVATVHPGSWPWSSPVGSPEGGACFRLRSSGNNVDASCRPASGARPVAVGVRMARAGSGAADPWGPAMSRSDRPGPEARARVQRLSRPQRRRLAGSRGRPGRRGSREAECPLLRPPRQRLVVCESARRLGEQCRRVSRPAGAVGAGTGAASASDDGSQLPARGCPSSLGRGEGAAWPHSQGRRGCSAWVSLPSAVCLSEPCASALAPSGDNP